MYRAVRLKMEENMGTENNELLDGQQSDDEGIFGEALADGMGFLTRFWEEKYLKEYIRDGGSKIKFITGRPGSGKTYFLQQMTNLAQQENYKTVWFSAKDIWMHDFKEIYVEIFPQCDILECLEKISHTLIADMGIDYRDIP